MSIEKQISDEVIKSLKDRNFLNGLKHLAVKNQNYGLGANIRDMQVTNFPEKSLTDEQYKSIENYRLVLRMVGIELNEATAYLLIEVNKSLIKMGDKFDILTASKIKANAEELF